MPWTEALQGVRMAMFLKSSAPLGIDGAQPGGGGGAVGGERADVPALDPPLRKARPGWSTAGSARRRAGGSRPIGPRRSSSSTASVSHEHLMKDHGFGWGYTWTKLYLQWTGVAPKAPRRGAHRA